MLENRKNKRIDYSKYIVDFLYFGGLLVSLVFTIIMYVAIGSNTLEKSVYFVFAVVTDLGKGEAGSRAMSILTNYHLWNFKSKKYILSLFLIFIFTTCLYFGLAYISLKASEGSQIMGVQKLRNENYENSESKKDKDALKETYDNAEKNLNRQIEDLNKNIENKTSTVNSANNNTSNNNKDINNRIEANQKIIENANKEREQALKNNPKLKDNGTLLSGISKKKSDAEAQINKDRALLNNSTTNIDTSKETEELRELNKKLDENNKKREELITGKVVLNNENDIKTAQDLQWSSKKEKENFYFFVAVMLEVEVVWAGMLRQNRRKKRDIEINGIDNSNDELEKNLDEVIKESWKEAKEKTKKDMNIKGDKKEMLGFLNKKKTPTQKKQIEVSSPEITLETVENVKKYEIPYKSIREDITKETKNEEAKSNILMSEIEKKAREMADIDGKLPSHKFLANALNCKETEIKKCYYMLEQLGKAEARKVGERNIGTWLI